MSNEYTAIDTSLISESVSIVIYNELTKGGDSGVVPLQFPPIIKSDSKKANWKDSNIGSYEPFSFWMGSDARVLSVQLEYVVTARSNFIKTEGVRQNGAGGVNVWNVANIMNALRTLKSYFYITIEKGQATYPLVKAVFYEYSPPGGDSANERTGTWRLHDINITPSGGLIVDGDQVCHLKHTVTMSMSLITQQLTLDKAADDENITKEEIDAIQLNARDRAKGGAISPWF